MNAPIQLLEPATQDAAALLQQRLARLEAMLQQSRDHVILAMDREIEAVRGWLEQLPTLDPTLALRRTPQERPLIPLDNMLTEAPVPVPGKVVPFQEPPAAAPFQEPSVDPHLEQATMEELNAALAAAFQSVSES